MYSVPKPSKPPTFVSLAFEVIEAGARRPPSVKLYFLSLIHICPFGLNYSRFIAGLSKAGIMVDRKVLSDLAITEPVAFEAIVGQAKSALA